jgi:hypothetical protein
MAPKRRPKHPNKDLEAIIRAAEDHGWTVEKNPRGYYWIKCPCKAHQRGVHITPSDPKYPLNVSKWLERKPCWNGEEPTP